MTAQPPESLGDRQGQILVAIVREHIRTADPVGSKHLVGKFNLSVSSATVRNDMARLEDLGYLTHPHTSAGRIPTDLGYRFYVDQTGAAKLGAQQRARIEGALAAEHGGLDELLRRASEILSRTTNLAAAAVTPGLTTSRLKHLDLAWISPRRAIVVMIGDGGRVEKRVVDLDIEMTEDELEAEGMTLNRALAGSSVPDAQRAARLRAADPESSPGAAAVAAAVAGALATFLEADQEVVVDGAANLASSSALGPTAELARVFEVIERRVDLPSVLAGAEPPASVRIGAEVPLEDLQVCSLVVAPYSPGAAIGVIGPTRMEYPRVIAAVSLMARLLGDAVQDLS